MTTTLFTFIGLYDRALATCEHLLKKGEAYAADKGLAAADILDWRLIDDMHPLRYQLTTVLNFTRNWPARVAGLALPGEIDSPTTDLAGFHAAIAEARAALAALTTEQIDSRDATPITYALGNGMEPTLSGAQWLTGFAATNINFHTAMVYAILRSKGVGVGKVDLFPLGL